MTGIYRAGRQRVSLLYKFCTNVQKSYAETLMEKTSSQNINEKAKSNKKLDCSLVYLESMYILYVILYLAHGHFNVRPYVQKVRLN